MKTTNKIVVYIFTCSLILALVSVVLAQEKQEQEKIICPKCNAINVTTAKFCHKCGAKLPEQKIDVKPADQKANGSAVDQKINAKSTDQLPDTGPLIPAQESLTGPDSGKSVAPKEPDATGTLAANELKARALYNYGLAMFEESVYDKARLTFAQIVNEYPETKYKDSAKIMVNACHMMENRMKKLELESSKKNNGNRALVNGCLGGFLGTGAAFLLLIILASGMND